MDLVVNDNLNEVIIDCEIQEIDVKHFKKLVIKKVGVKRIEETKVKQVSIEHNYQHEQENEKRETNLVTIN